MGTVYLCYGQKGSLIMSDTHLALAVVFDVPEGQDFKSYFPKFYAIVKGGTKDCLYYGFATCGNKVLCREGYKGAPGLLAHMGEVKGELEGMIKQLGKERVKILMSGPASELEKVKPHMDSRLTVKYVELDSGALQLNAFPKGCQDTHITILPEFVIPAGKLDEFKAGFSKFYAATKNGPGAAGCLYYGFGFAGDSMYCREGYKTAGAGNFKLNVVGPAAELEKLKPKLAPRGAIFWELDSGSFHARTCHRTAAREKSRFHTRYDIEAEA